MRPTYFHELVFLLQNHSKMHCGCFKTKKKDEFEISPLNVNFTESGREVLDRDLEGKLTFPNSVLDRIPIVITKEKIWLQKIFKNLPESPPEFIIHAFGDSKDCRTTGTVLIITRRKHARL
jgi:hypothetical protein